MRPRRCWSAARPLLGNPDAARHVVTDRSTPEGLRALAESRGSRRDRVLLGLPHRQRPHRRRQLGRAPDRRRPHRDRDRAGRLAAEAAEPGIRNGSSPSATATAERRRPPRRWRARSERPSRRSLNADADLLVVDSRPEAEQGRISISSSASHLIEIAMCSVLVVPRGVDAAVRPHARRSGRLAAAEPARHAGELRARPPAPALRSSVLRAAARSREQMARESFEEVQCAAQRSDRPGPSRATSPGALRVRASAIGRSRSGTVSWQACQPP